MSDFATIWNPANGTGDWVMAGTQIATGADLVSAVLISVFTDRIANADDVISDNTTDPRGWWGDFGADYPIGSRMWLLNRSKQTTDVLKRAKDYLTEALKWLIDDGAVAKFDIVTEFTRAGMLGAQITAWKKTGRALSMRFSWVWNVLAPGVPTVSFIQLFDETGDALLDESGAPLFAVP